MANPNNIIPFILKWEGKTSKDPADRAAAYPVPDGSGVHTNKGVTWRVWESVFGNSADSVHKFYSMASSDWTQIFKPLFWDKVGGDKIKSQRIADVLVNWAWAAGVSTPAKTIQKIVGVTPDGIIGNQTIAAINNSNEVDTFTKLKAANISFFNDLASRPKYSSFKGGWTNRLNDLFTNYVTKTNSLLTFALIGLVAWVILKNK
jgi:hypothetical protein